MDIIIYPLLELAAGRWFEKNLGLGGLMFIDPGETCWRGSQQKQECRKMLYCDKLRASGSS